ncbi:conserved hypothetical protein [Ricinus communis]|uniref:Uncharacterized protein n=1 Tax=Ricinus communis TaxID=3988 RepID=B9T2T5_RICCO|nr:conserved hypothetical protein [Ricinus communis]
MGIQNSERDDHIIIPLIRNFSREKINSCKEAQVDEKPPPPRSMQQGKELGQKSQASSLGANNREEKNTG